MFNFVSLPQQLTAARMFVSYYIYRLLKDFILHMQSNDRIIYVDLTTPSLNLLLLMYYFLGCSNLHLG